MFMVGETDARTVPRQLYAEYSTALGFRVMTARDGQSGIVAATQHRPAAIVMDLSMPKIDGITAIKHLKSDTRTRRYPFKAIEQGALEAGAA